MSVQTQRQNVRLFDVQMMGLPEFTGVYLLQGPSSVLVDAGTLASADALVDWLRDLGTPPRYVVITHAHHDHIGALDAILRAFGRDEVQVLATPEGARRLRDPDGVNRVYGAEGLAAVDHVRVVEDGEELELDGMQLTFFHTPGHSADSLAMYERVSDTLFPGDLPGDFLWGTTFLPPNAAADFDEHAFRQSMDRMMGIDADCIALPHFGFFEGEAARRLLPAQLRRYEQWRDALLGAHAQRRDQADVSAAVRTLLGGSRFASMPAFEQVADAFAAWCMMGYRSAGLVAGAE